MTAPLPGYKAHIFVRRLFPVRTPVPFVSTGSRIEYDDTVIEIAISYVNLVCFRIDFGIRRTAKTRNVIAVGLPPRFSDLQDECPSARELQILSVIVAGTTDPNEPEASMVMPCSFCGQS
jgi:hypothetical protein